MESKLTVQHAWARVMLKAPDGPGRSRHVSLDELQAFIDRAKAEARAMCKGREEKYQNWLAHRNVALMDSQLYIDTPWGEVQEAAEKEAPRPCAHADVVPNGWGCGCTCPRCYDRSRPGKRCICPLCKCQKENTD